MEQNIRKTIKTIHEKLKLNNIRWALVGSTNMQLQGMDTYPRDLDIVIQHKDLEKISDIFSDYSTSIVKQFKTLSGKPAWEVKTNINDIEVQFFGGKDDDIYVSKMLANRISMIKMDDIKIPCFNLEAEEQAYRETNREHKAKLIRDFLYKKK